VAGLQRCAQLVPFAGGALANACGFGVGALGPGLGCEGALRGLRGCLLGLSSLGDGLATRSLGRAHDGGGAAGTLD
jgi:hypothetical protein